MKNQRRQKDERVDMQQGMRDNRMTKERTQNNKREKMESTSK